jgi:hypothetical protein
LNKIQQGSRSVDVAGLNPKTLWEKNAYQHAMTPGAKVRELGSYESAKAWAKDEARKFVNENLQEAKSLYEKSKTTPDVGRGRLMDESFANFGEAMHTVMDNISPAHRVFQVYDNKASADLGSVTYGSAVGNVGGGLIGMSVDMLKHKSDESAPPTEAEMNVMVDRMRMQFLNTYGREAYENAVSEDERKKTAERLGRRETTSNPL